jgi:hypothetical protein
LGKAPVSSTPLNTAHTMLFFSLIRFNKKTPIRRGPWLLHLWNRVQQLEITLLLGDSAISVNTISKLFRLNPPLNPVNSGLFISLISEDRCFSETPTD